MEKLRKMKLKEKFMAHKEENIPFVAMLVICIGVLIIFACTSCKSVERVQVVHDTITRDVVVKEYQYKHDTSYIDRYHYETIKGDTLWLRDSIFVYRGNVSVDTIHDTLTTGKVINTVEKEIVEHKVRGFFWWFGIVSTLIMMVFIVWLVLFYFKAKKGIFY